MVARKIVGAANEAAPNGATSRLVRAQAGDRLPVEVTEHGPVRLVDRACVELFDGGGAAVDVRNDGLAPVLARMLRLGRIRRLGTAEPRAPCATRHSSELVGRGGPWFSCWNR